MRANPRAWAPFYVVVYPMTSTVVTSGPTLLCLHTPVENCPDHGPEVAALAPQVEPSVYGAGVAGHDHLMDFPGGEGFNVAWEPIVVLFTSSQAANQHLLTDAQIDEAVANGDAVEVPAPALTFHCEPVAKVAYTRATPVSSHVLRQSVRRAAVRGRRPGAPSRPPPRGFAADPSPRG